MLNETREELDMTLDIRNSDDEVTALSAADIAEAVKLTVASTGFTVRQLREQAEHDEFPSERARTVWFSVKDVVDQR